MVISQERTGRTYLFVSQISQSLVGVRQLTSPFWLGVGGRVIKEDL